MKRAVIEHRAIRLVAAAICLLAAAGCGARVATPEPLSLSAVDPTPHEFAPITMAPQSEQDCSAEASLRPGALPSPAAMPAGTPMAEIVARGRVRIGVDQNTYLFGFRDPTTGRLEGFDIDIAREIARALFGDPDRVELRSVTAAERTTALKEHTVDLVVRTFSATCQRRQDVDFSAVYYRAAQRILVPTGSSIRSTDDLRGKRVCVANGTTSAGPLFALPTRVTVLGVTNWTDCLAALQQGHVDAVSGDDPILYGLVAQDRNLSVVGDPIGDGAYAVGIAKGNADLVRFVNAVLERIRSDGTWQRIYEQRLSVLGPTPTPPTPKYSD
ncbi:glutamate ABC transporter substrate-binding protein [Nocardia arizonensis]|uniref:glutamate ABC transporter substrate-binding protein n=1 Tax=Nocardia arizonensis TaxID=1141647 RepID=UPI000AE3FDF1|nr:glutamate ABC transporter substrate-binding protein [Nocardia arizonensis]